MELDQGDLMVSVWMGTQANEYFSDAWHLDATTTSIENISHTSLKLCVSPRLWHLIFNLIRARDLLLKIKTGNNEIFIQSIIGI